MRYCARCLYPANHPLTITFDEVGVCSGCRIHEEKDALDWQARGERLRALFDRYRNKSESNYDCIIPVSGARDSYFIVHTVKKAYGLNPLLVHYNKHYNTSRGHRNLAYLRTIFDCDQYQMVPSPDLLRRITRRTLELRASMYWHCIAGATVLPVQVAVRYKIPLIVWGAHQGVDQVGMFSHLDEVEMTRKYRKNHDLMGLEGEDLVSDSDELSEEDMQPFLYPHDKEIEKVGVRGIYLNNFMRWDGKAQHEEMIRLYGYETARQQRTFDTYNDVDCPHYSGLHDYIKFLKHGYGKVTDHACREIRLRRLTREDGIERVRRYQDRRPKDLTRFLEWIGMTEDELWKLVDSHRDAAIWEGSGKGEWRLKDSVIDQPAPDHADDVALGVAEDCAFQVTTARGRDHRATGYPLITRGYVDGYAA